MDRSKKLEMLRNLRDGEKIQLNNKFIIPNLIFKEKGGFPLYDNNNKRLGIYATKSELMEHLKTITNYRPIIITTYECSECIKDNCLTCNL